MIQLIAAMGKNNEIGKNNVMPWHLPADLAYFKQATSNHTVLMGRKTYESIGKALPNRKNVVLTNDKEYRLNDAMVIHDLHTILKHYQDSEEVLFVIGGANVYEQCLPYADTLYITRIHHEFEADAFFPMFHESEWKETCVMNGETNEKNPYAYGFYLYERN